jgi:hypothetical protein
MCLYLYSNSRQKGTFERTKWSQATELILCRAQETTYVAAIDDIEAQDIYAAP